MWEFLETQTAAEEPSVCPNNCLNKCFCVLVIFIYCVSRQSTPVWLVGLAAVVEVNIVYKAVRTIVDLASTLTGHESFCPGNIKRINYINNSIGQCQRNIVYCPCQFQSIQLYEYKMFELVQFVMPSADDSQPTFSRCRLTVNSQRLQPAIPQYISRFGHRSYCYAELAVSSLLLLIAV